MLKAGSVLLREVIAAQSRNIFDWLKFSKMSSSKSGFPNTSEVGEVAASLYEPGAMSFTRSLYYVSQSRMVASHLFWADKHEQVSEA